MISVAAAKKIIHDNMFTRPVVNMPLNDAAHLQLAADLYSPVDSPAYPQSSMDGYAFAYADWRWKNILSITGEMQAGAKVSFSLLPGQAARIFTGAPLPTGADTVVMQEKVSAVNNELTILDENLQAGGNVRLTGSAIKTGELALEKNSFLSPGAIGFLAGMGISHVPVFAPPIVSIIVTGKELQQPGNALQFGEVYESNSYALQAALNQLQVKNVRVYSADDELGLVKQVLDDALAGSDMVLLTGGVSVGDYDFVVQAAEACGVIQLFHKIKQRPGKPLYFGRKENKLVFGLPGNPSSVLSCFYEYVTPALKAGLPALRVPLAKSCIKPAGLTHFLKAWYDGESVMPLDAQESYRMSSFAKANCLIQLDEETTICKAGDLTTIHLLPF
ncbi:MAG: molybdopterin molybdotransferase MoeA [Chitinophagaceae bacterium]